MVKIPFNLKARVAELKQVSSQSCFKKQFSGLYPSTTCCPTNTVDSIIVSSWSEN